MSRAQPIVVLTAGEPAGIGPDLLVMLAQHAAKSCLVAVTDPELLEQRAHALGLSLRIDEFSGAPHRPGRMQVQPISLSVASVPGELCCDNAGFVLQTLDRAADGCVAGEFDAMVTAPVHKGVINDAAIPFTGHTEYLAQRTGAPQAVMMLVSGQLRVALATTHVPLREVAARITRPLLRAVIRVLASDLKQWFGKPDPIITVCGLNPHAGESGHLGTEELAVMIPALDELRCDGLRLLGPVPADTAFVAAELKKTDAVLAMYHDQGLPVIKHAGFGEAVNVTLGLPIIRTSVDHGTALERAASGAVELGSLNAALRLAERLVRDRHTA
ncbi:MAG: 4-hydroxythreonine-4-phosphate dehydrogenase PdxA [Gammaproteobacteria bacterium]|nr:4-hydroxythreonine-4-phosphate dehydrogenase PdxA [Gammaproteobacteria bacterium]MDH3464438.1 4-hydroxythreonine-4-phosphate dehydrogenase PdxA [Gammaproteobacteria bacterium]